jgi:serine/threonine protein kinase
MSEHHTRNPCLSFITKNNVLVDSQRRARIADFGISSTTSNTHTQATADRGTYHYKAPELNKYGSKPSEESDFFSLALLIWEVCTTGWGSIEGNS